MLSATRPSLAQRIRAVPRQQIEQRRLCLFNFLLEQRRQILDKLHTDIETAIAHGTTLSLNYHFQSIIVDSEARHANFIGSDSSVFIALMRHGASRFKTAVQNITKIYFPLISDPRFLHTQLQAETRDQVRLFRNLVDRLWEKSYGILRKSANCKKTEPQKSTEDVIEEEDYDDEAGGSEVSTHRRKLIRKEVVISEKPKSKNCKMPTEATSPLQKWLLEHFEYPYPTLEERDELSKKSGIPPHSVTNWFINTRERVVKRIYKKESMRMIPLANKTKRK